MIFSLVIQSSSAQAVREHRNKTVNTPNILLFIFVRLEKSIVLFRIRKRKMTGKKVLLKTSMGDINIELAEDMPITAGNFEKLVAKGYYNGTVFHRIIAGFMIQGGDPTGTGRGGPGYAIKDEFGKNNKNDIGTISMANAGPNTGGSQFFINLINNSFLDKKHPVFGKVVSGMDVVEKMGKVRTAPGDRPVTEVKIITAAIV